MPRFFVDASCIADGRVEIGGDDAHHISRSLRMACGETIIVCDQSGIEHVCELDSFGDKSVGARIVESRRSENEPPYRVTLYQAYPKGDKAEYIVQKAVELGAYEIVFFESSRCISRIIGEKQDKKIERYSRIALEAAKQCGRAIVPKVSEPLSFTNAVASAAQNEIALFCYEEEASQTLKGALDGKTPRTVSVMIGSEGGFSAEEALFAKNSGMIPIGLGNRILRTETASGYVLSALSYTYEL